MALITCENVSIGYEGQTVVKELNFSIERGDYLCIVGENGSGKSTLVKSLLGLKGADRGKIIYGDGLKKNEIGYLPQKNEEQKVKQKEEISNLLNNNPQLRSKRELIEKFINENLVKIDNSDSIEDEFIKFWDEEKVKAFEQIANEENLNKDELKKVDRKSVV